MDASSFFHKREYRTFTAITQNFMWLVGSRHISLISLHFKKRKSHFHWIFTYWQFIYVCGSFSRKNVFISVFYSFVQFCSFQFFFSSSANILTIFHMSCLLYVLHPAWKYIFLTKLARRNHWPEIFSCDLRFYIQGVTGGRDKTSGECSLC